ncbi:MAG: VOC family protein [Bacteroidetes bacterium]|jgi:predicted enzyme related to lactoylglutathione lyase|nr:VOC family protein [Bacteroidota bacterium]
MKKRVIGIGGIFFKCKDPDATREWYGKHLGLVTNEYGSTFEFRNAEKPEEKNYLQWSTFKEDTNYMEPSKASFMINYRVEDLHALVKELKAEGVQIVDEIEEFEYGKFVHIMDPEGNKVELWEAVNEVYGEMGDGETTA